MMSQRLQLLRLQAEAFRRHGLTRDQFLKITPAELSALNADALAEWKTEKEMDDTRTARVIAAIYNNNPNKKRGKVYSEKDFMPAKAKGPVRTATATDLFSKVKWIHAAIHAEAKRQKKHGD